MTTDAALRAIDATIHAAFAEAGFAFTAQYYAPGVASTGTGSPMRCTVDKGVEFYGEYNQVVGVRDEASFLLADGTPAKGGMAMIEGERYRIGDLLSRDGSMARHVVVVI